MNRLNSLLLLLMIVSALLMVQCDHDIDTKQSSETKKGEYMGQRETPFYSHDEWMEKGDYARFIEEESELGEDRGTVYLTFDDGPSIHTREILNILDYYDVQASFFVNGRESDLAIDMYQQMVDEGHVVGNHTYTHEYENIYSDMDNFKEDFFRLERHLENITGERMKYFRFPGGSNSSMGKRFGGEQILYEVREFLKKNGYLFFDWDVDSGDSTGNDVSSHSIVQQTLQQIQGKDTAVVLFHDGATKGTTVEALPVIISQLKAWGYTFKPISSGAPRREFHL